MTSHAVTLWRKVTGNNCRNWSVRKRHHMKSPGHHEPIVEFKTKRLFVSKSPYIRIVLISLFGWFCAKKIRFTFALSQVFLGFTRPAEFQGLSKRYEHWQKNASVVQPVLTFKQQVDDQPWMLNHAHTTMKMVEVSLVYTTRLLYFCCLGKRVDFGRIQIFLAKRYRKTLGSSIYHHLSSLLEVVWSDSSRGPRSKASWHVAHEGFFDQTTGPSSLPTSLTCIPWLLKGTHLNHTSSTPKMWCYQSGSFLWSSKQTGRRLSLRHSNDCFRMALIT